MTRPARIVFEVCASEAPGRICSRASKNRIAVLTVIVYVEKARRSRSEASKSALLHTKILLVLTLSTLLAFSPRKTVEDKERLPKRQAKKA
jgi:hypothetical protein